MKTKLLVLAVLCIGISSFVTAEGRTATEKCSNPDISTVDAFGPEVASKAPKFLVDLQTAVRSDDRNAVASMMYYPLSSSSLKIRTRVQFLRNYDEIWTESVKKALLTENPACLAYASSGYTPDNGSQTAFVIGRIGEIWFDAIRKSGTMKVITINN